MDISGADERQLYPIRDSLTEFRSTFSQREPQELRPNFVNIKLGIAHYHYLCLNGGYPVGR